MRLEFDTFSTDTVPDPKNVPEPIDGDPDDEINWPVRDFTIPYFDVDGGDEQNDINRVEGPVLPFGHTIQDPVDDRGDGRLRHLDPIDFSEVR
jgi:hypothetical protein